jgi:epoxyqueuosine reductase QueG
MTMTASTTSLTSTVTTELQAAQIEIYGIVSSDAFVDAPAAHHPNAVLSSAKSVIIFGLPHLKSTYDRPTAEPYAFIRNTLSDKINRISMSLAYTLEANDFDAIPIDAVGPTTKDKTGRSRGIISLKHAAALAGLGTFGKNTLILNKTYGNRLWFGAIITSAPLTPILHDAETLCIEGCTRCIESCKAKALLPSKPFIHQGKCWAHAFDSSDERLQITCFECRRTCPVRFGIRA